MSLKQNSYSSDDISNNSMNVPNNDNETHKIPFWASDPNILFKQEYIFEFFPVDGMTYEQKLNAVSRTVIILTIFGFVISQSVRLLFISFLTMFSIYMLHYYQDRENQKSKKIYEENMDNLNKSETQADVVLKQANISRDPNVFDKPNSNNPFSNVLIPDYEYNPGKKPAPPAFNENTNDQILEQAKKLVSELNPGQPDIAEKLFRDLGEQYVFEQSMRQFSSNPSTTIPNDQTGFAEFCYGSMVSAKEGNLFAAARNLPRYNNY